MNCPPGRASRDRGGPRQCSPVGMLKGFSESAPRQGVQGWRTRTRSKNCGFPAHHPIFRPSTAREGSGTPPPCGGELLARARGALGRPGPRLRGQRAGKARTAELQPESDSRAGASAPRATYTLRRGRQRDGPCPGYWPPADPPHRYVRQCGRLRSLLSLASGLFAQLRPI